MILSVRKDKKNKFKQYRTARVEKGSTVNKAMSVHTGMRYTDGNVCQVQVGDGIKAFANDDKF